MSTSTAIAPRQDLGPAMPVRRWTTAEFDEMVNKGIIREGSSTFLWDGEIIEPMSENQPHRNAVANLFRLLIRRLPEEAWTVDQNGPLSLRDGYKPQPDLSVLKGPRSRYNTRVPVPEDVALLVEVSDSTYAGDLNWMMKEYAARGITQSWIVNIAERRVEVYTRPNQAADGTTGYLDRIDYGLGETVPVVVENGDVRFECDGVSVRDILRNSLEAEAR